jgi:hypothetical protein
MLRGIGECALMGDQVTRKDIQAVQKQLDDLKKRLDEFVNKTFQQQISGVYTAILEGDKVAEQKVAPLRDKTAAIEKRLTALED